MRSQNSVIAPALIVGGGPAGAAAGIALARGGARPLLIERASETGDAICGGFLSWRTLEALERLGLATDALGPRVVTQVRLIAGAREVTRPLPRPGRSVSRRRLDTLLLALAERAGVAVERGVTARAAEGGSVRTADGATLTPDALFLATGKHDLRGLARPAAARGSDPTLGLRVRLAPGPAIERMIGRAVELHLLDRGYAGVAIQEDGTANCCMAVHRSRLEEAAGDVEALLATLGRECPPLGDRLAHRAPGPADAIANVPYGWWIRDGTAGLFRLGDQAAVIPSLAGEGIGIALASGTRAAAAWLRSGPAAAPEFQRALARDLARPLAVAGAARAIVERPCPARAALTAAAITPGLIHVIARLTRVPHNPVDAPQSSQDNAAAWIS